MPKAMRYAGWLPPVRDGGCTGWLAFQGASVAAIAGAVTLEMSASTRIRQSLVRALTLDPALLMFTAALLQRETLSRREDPLPRPDRGRYSGTTTLAQMADWWCRRGRELWRQTDWLAAPEGSAAETRLKRLEQVDDYFRLLPRARWIAEADLWFAAAGIPNPLDDSFEVDWSDDLPLVATEPFAKTHLTIASWVREQDNRDVSDDAFAVALKASRRELAHTLAYGLSHEINNPLTNISTRAQALQTRVPPPLVDSAQRIVDQTSRAHAMIADLMFYANPPPIQPSEFDLIARIEMVMESSAELAQRVGIELRCANVDRKSRMIVRADAEMIGEAIAALVRNSIEAIGTDGHVRVEVVCDESSVRISVADSGPGISADAAAMATSPYYSGREAGRGLGLGLCRAERIAGLHGGSLQLSPALAGCVATIVLPVDSQRDVDRVSRDAWVPLSRF